MPFPPYDEGDVAMFAAEDKDQEQPHPQPERKWDSVMIEIGRAYEHWAYRRWWRFWQAVQDLMRAYDKWLD